MAVVKKIRSRKSCHQIACELGIEKKNRFKELCATETTIQNGGKQVRYL